MNAEMMQKLIEYGARQERSRNDFIADLINQYIPVIGSENQPVATPVTKPTKTTARRGRKPSTNGLTAQIRNLLDQHSGGYTITDIATAIGEDNKKVSVALSNMRVRGAVFRVGQQWHLMDASNGAAASI